MDNRFERLQKFIIKKIVRTVEFSPTSEEYIFNRIQIDSDITSEIVEEGKVYGLSRDEAIQFIHTTSTNIKAQPFSEISHNSVKVDEIRTGQHLTITIIHPDKGKRCIELLSTGKQRFLLLSSEIQGLMCGDCLYSLDKLWINSYCIEFLVERDGKRIPDDHSILKIGKLDAVEMFYPSAIHEILDSNSNFKKKREKKNVSENSTQTKKTVDTKKNVSNSAGTVLSKEKSKETNPQTKQKKQSTENVKPKATLSNPENRKQTTGDRQRYYLWLPNKWVPIQFEWSLGDIDDKTSTFIVEPTEQEDKYRISINPNFNLRETIHRDMSFIQVLYNCCKYYTPLTNIERQKVHTVQSGILRTIKNDPWKKIWRMEQKPTITFE